MYNRVDLNSRIMLHRTQEKELMMPLFGKSPEQEDAERKEDEQRERQRDITKERARRVQLAEIAIRDFNAEQAPKWDYFRLHTWNDANHWYIDYGTKELYSRLDQILDELGDRGWELVGISTKVTTVATSVTYTYCEDFIFKRPKFVIPDELRHALELAKAYNGE